MVDFRGYIQLRRTGVGCPPVQPKCEARRALCEGRKRRQGDEHRDYPAQHLSPLTDSDGPANDGTTCEPSERSPVSLDSLFGDAPQRWQTLRKIRSGEPRVAIAVGDEQFDVRVLIDVQRRDPRAATVTARTSQ
jgi:hypothetical protein